MKAIVAIGGGEIKRKETLAIDKEIIRLSGKKRPKLLFIPTASSDAVGYWETIQEYFGDYLGCRTDVLFLIKDKPSRTEIRKKILSSDIVYVGGGNTLKMVKLWRHFGVDKVLKIAYQKGIVLSGISAGSICWFEAGLSDSMSFYNPKRWNYIKVRGLGLLKGIHCPHYNSRGRKKNFQNMIQKVGGLGIALENNCAIEFIPLEIISPPCSAGRGVVRRNNPRVDLNTPRGFLTGFINGKYFRVITSKPQARAYKVYKKDGRVLSEKIEKKKELSPLTELLHR